MIVIGIYCVFIGYSLSFYWKQDVFFELFRFHTLFTFISTCIFTISYITHFTSFSILHPITGIIGIIAGLFLLSFTKKESFVFLTAFLLSLFATCYLSIIGIYPDIHLLSLLFIGTILAFSIFEFFPKTSLFESSTEFLQYFSLFTILIFLPFLLFIAITTLQALSIVLLLSIALFFLLIHTRYINYIVFIISILIIYFVYSILFSDLIHEPTATSLFLFVFFLPILIIGTTYFWNEKHQYDFQILHYSSIIFSIIFSLYLIFFAAW